MDGTFASISYTLTGQSGRQIATFMAKNEVVSALVECLWKGANDMAQIYTLQFIHRLNDDGTIDSICRDCFATVATSISGAELEREEQEHICDTLLIERYKKVPAH